MTPVEVFEGTQKAPRLRITDVDTVVFLRIRLKMNTFKFCGKKYANLKQLKLICNN